MEKFTLDNYSKGFLMDEELMGGVSEDREAPGTFNAFIVRHTTGETLGFQQFTNLFEAIRTLNSVERDWAFTPVSKCGSGNCGNGNCGKGGGGCGKKKTTPTSTQDQDPSCSTGECQTS
jgi:hypothetical protein